MYRDYGVRGIELHLDRTGRVSGVVERRAGGVGDEKHGFTLVNPG